MKLNSIHIRNFFSIQDIKINFDEYNGIVLLEGKNKDASNGSNGVGKSSIFEAIVWCLFGRTVRKSTEETLINNKAKKDCEVKLTINDTIVITRTKRPTFLTFEVDGENKTKESINATQEVIDAYFNTNYKTFLTSVLFGQQNEIDFISASPEDKRTIIKNFLQLEEIFELREKVKKKRLDLASEIRAKDSVCNEYKKNIDSLEQAIKELEYKQTNLLSKLNLTKSISLDEIIILEKKHTDLVNLDKKIEEETYEALKLQTQLEKKLIGKCSYCNSIIRSLSEQEVKDIKNEIVELDVLINTNNNKLLELKNEIDKFVIPISSSKYKEINELSTFKSKINSFTEVKVSYQYKLEEIFEQKKKITKTHEILKFWEDILSEHGVIKYIIRSIIGYFNNRCNYYLGFLVKGKFIITFDETLTESIKINNIPASYHSLSGGEKKKINLAVLLALQGLLDYTGKGKYNILMLDEVVESIDEESLQGLHNLLLKLSQEKLILVITHNSTLKDLLVERPSIKLVKQNGITKLKQN